MDAKVAAGDRAVALVAARQHGMVSVRQLREAGISKESTRRRLESGRLHRMHQGVYALGYLAPTYEGRWMAAVLACSGYEGVDLTPAFVSHRSAAELWELLPRRAGPVDVAIVGETGRAARRGLRIHRPRTLELEMTTRKDGIPVTNPQRTVSDLRRAKPNRGGATPKELRRAMRQAAVLGLPLGRGTKPERTRSDLEILFQQICRRHRLPPPAVNVKVAPLLEVDFLWPKQRLAVETDGYRYHRGRVAFESDHDRDLRLAELGIRVRRFSERQLEKEPARVARIVRRELAAT